MPTADGRVSFQAKFSHYQCDRLCALCALRLCPSLSGEEALWVQCCLES